MYLMQLTGTGGDPGFVSMYRAVFPASPPLDHLIAAILFIISGGLWGLVFTLLVKDPKILNGFLFGILPTLWLWLVVNAVLGRPLFNGFQVKGIVMPLIFNMLIWGTFVGFFSASRLRANKRFSAT